MLCEDEKGVRDAPAMRYKTSDVARLEACLPAFRPVFMKVTPCCSFAFLS